MQKNAYMQYIAELIVFAYQTIFLRKIQIVCGIWFAGFPAVRMYYFSLCTLQTIF